MIKILAETPRDQKIIDALRKASKWKDKRIADLEEELEKQREKDEEYKKRHPSNIGEKNGKTYEIKPEIMPQPAERKRPGQKTGHRGFFRKTPDRIDEVENVPIHRCPVCSSRLSSVQEIRDRTVEDIPVPKAMVTRYRLERRYCKHCKVMVEGQVDCALPNARISLRAMLAVAFLKIRMRLSGEMVAETMSNMFGIVVSVGEVPKILDQVSEAFGDRYSDLIRIIRDAPARNMDSTSWRNDGKNEYLWTFVTRGEAIFRISRSNGHEVPLEVLGKHNGTDIHDRHSAFETLASRTKNPQQYCESHIKCDAKELEKFYGSEGNRLLRSLKRVYDEAKSYHGRGTMEDVQNLYHRLVFLLDSDYDHVKCRHFVDNLLKRKKEWLFQFVMNPDVESTNNRAERALRPSVIYRKSNGGTRSERGDRYYETLASVLYSSKLGGGSIMEDGQDEIRKWMDKMRKKKMQERIQNSMKSAGLTS